MLAELLAAEGALDPETERELVELREACFRSEDFYEGVRAFAEKRKPGGGHNEVVARLVLAAALTLALSAAAPAPRAARTDTTRVAVLGQRHADRVAPGHRRRRLVGRAAPDACSSARAVSCRPRVQAAPDRAAWWG